MSDLVKYCSKCGLEKDLQDFHQQKSGFKGRRADCKACRGCTRRKRNTPEQRRAYIKAWTKKNRDILRIKSRDRKRKRRKEDPQFRLKERLRQRIGKAIRQDRRPGSAVRDLGCSIGDLKIYLESKFQPGMTWDNYGAFGWHIDHVKPLASFNLIDPVQFRQAVHYTNLQPLWRIDNIRKGGKDLDHNASRRYYV